MLVKILVLYFYITSSDPLFRNGNNLAKFTANFVE